jgi:hypothetical protein
MSGMQEKLLTEMYTIDVISTATKAQPHCFSSSAEHLATQDLSTHEKGNVNES